MSDNIPQPHYKKLWAFALEKYEDIETAKKKYRGMRDAASALTRAGGLEGFSPDQIEWQQVLAGRQSLKRAREDTAVQQEAANVDGDNEVMIVEGPAAPADAAAAHDRNLSDDAESDQPQRKKPHSIPGLSYPVTPEIVDITIQQLRNTPLATWPLQELHAVKTDISAHETKLHGELVTETREIKAFKSKVHQAKGLVVDALCNAANELTTGLEADEVGDLFKTDVLQHLEQGKAQAEKRAMQLLNSPEQKAMTDKLLAQQQQVAAIRECKAEVQRAIELEQDADGYPSDAEYGRFYQAQPGGNGPKYEETSHATECTAATGTTGSTLRRLFSWGRW